MQAGGSNQGASNITTGADNTESTGASQSGSQRNGLASGEGVTEAEETNENVQQEIEPASATQSQETDSVDVTSTGEGPQQQGEEAETFSVLQPGKRAASVPRPKAKAKRPKFKASRNKGKS